MLYKTIARGDYIKFLLKGKKKKLVLGGGEIVAGKIESGAHWWGKRRMIQILTRFPLVHFGWQRLAFESSWTVDYIQSDGAAQRSVYLWCGEGSYKTKKIYKPLYSAFQIVFFTPPTGFIFIHHALPSPPHPRRSLITARDGDRWKS